MIEVESVRVRAGGVKLLDGVSLAVRPGEVVALLGANGAGKSTLLGAVAGDITPEAGAIRLAGRPVAGWTPAELGRVRAVLRQRCDLDFDFRVDDVVLLGRSVHSRRETRYDHAIAQAALREVGCDHLTGRSYLTLSGGERQRVQLARVLAQIWESAGGEGSYLLLDEPTASLDLREQHRVLAIARDFARRGGGVLAVVHDLNLASQYADRLVVLRKGRVVAAGEPAAVLTPETVQEAFAVTVCLMRYPQRRVPLIVAPDVSRRRPTESGRAPGARSHDP